MPAAVTANTQAISFGVKTTGIKALSVALKAANDGTARQLTKGLKAAGAIVQTKAQQNAGWSSKIPGKIKLTATANGISIWINDGEAISYETDGKHPVFSKNRSRWNKVPLIRPFLLPAAEATSDQVAAAILELVADFQIPEVME